MSDLPLVELHEIGPASSPSGDGAGQFVTLIRPAKVSSRFVMSSPLGAPLGIAYLAAVLREAGIPVACVDGSVADQLFKQGHYHFQGLTNDQICDRIDPRSTIIGISIMFSQDWPYARTLIRRVRERFPQALIVAGGEHITAAAEFSLRDCRELDVCVLGEGERTIVDLARTVDGPGDNLASVRGIAFLREEEFVRTAPRERIRDVDSLPYPAWDLLPHEAYLTSNNNFGVNRGRSLGILATRGCPYQCTFCSSPNMYGTSYFPRSPANVLDEIEQFIRLYGVQNFDFHDLTMILKREWVLEFCRAVEERGLTFTWQLPAGTRSEILDDEVAAALYRTGCRNVTYAPESGSVRILDIIKKRVHLDRLCASVRSALKHGLHVKCNIIIGFPPETRRDVFETWKFSLKLAWLGIDAVEPMLFIPYPGSQIYRELCADGTIAAMSDEYLDSLTAMQDPLVGKNYCKHIGRWELLFWRIVILTTVLSVSFALRPWRFLRLLWNVARDRSETVVEHRLSVLVRRSTAVPTQGMIATPSPSVAGPAPRSRWKLEGSRSTSA